MPPVNGKTGKQIKPITKKKTKFVKQANGISTVNVMPADNQFGKIGQ